MKLYWLLLVLFQRILPIKEVFEVEVLYPIMLFQFQDGYCDSLLHNILITLFVFYLILFYKEVVPLLTVAVLPVEIRFILMVFKALPTRELCGELKATPGLDWIL